MSNIWKLTYLEAMTPEQIKSLEKLVKEYPKDDPLPQALIGTVTQPIFFNKAKTRNNHFLVEKYSKLIRYLVCDLGIPVQRVAEASGGAFSHTLIHEKMKLSAKQQRTAKARLFINRYLLERLRTGDSKEEVMARFGSSVPTIDNSIRRYGTEEQKHDNELFVQFMRSPRDNEAIVKALCYKYLGDVPAWVQKKIRRGKRGRSKQQQPAAEATEQQPEKEVQQQAEEEPQQQKEEEKAKEEVIEEEIDAQVAVAVAEAEALQQAVEEEAQQQAAEAEAEAEHQTEGEQ